MTPPGRQAVGGRGEAEAGAGAARRHGGRRGAAEERDEDAEGGQPAVEAARQPAHRESQEGQPGGDEAPADRQLQPGQADLAAATPGEDGDITRVVNDYLVNHTGMIDVEVKK